MSRWYRISDYAIQGGEYTISKALVKESPRYTLWKGDQMIVIRDSAEELKKMVTERHAKEIEDV